MDLATFGQRLRHLRRSRGMTLAELGERVGRSPSVLSMYENGLAEPKMSMIEMLAGALMVLPEELLREQPPSRRAQLEIAVGEAQRDPLYRALGLPLLKIGARVPNDVLEHLVALYAELRRQRSRPMATPEEARVANAELRAAMRERGNYFEGIERAAVDALGRVGYASGAISQGMLLGLVTLHGFTVCYRQDLPSSVRSITDLRNRRIYLSQVHPGMHAPRTILLQTLGHFVLGHDTPRDYADFLVQRVEANYFAGAVLIPEQSAVPFLLEAKEARALSVEDLRDVFAVSYEMAAHRFTNLATHHLGLQCHFVKNDPSGIIYKAYENDGLTLPSGEAQTVEGQRMCRFWPGREVFSAVDQFSPYYQYLDTPSGSYWSVTMTDPGSEKRFAITLGVPYVVSRWFRGRETANRTKSTCPDPSCCQRPPAGLAARWEGMVWPSAQAHTHLLSALPSGIFPGVDETELYTFMERQEDS